ARRSSAGCCSSPARSVRRWAGWWFSWRGSVSESSDGSGELVVSGQGEEVAEYVGMSHHRKQVGGRVGAGGARMLAVTQAMGVRGHRVVEQGEVDRRLVREFEVAVMQPL